MHTSMLRSRREPRRIHDCFSEVLRFRVGQLGGLHVISAGAVAALAIDSFWQRRSEKTGSAPASSCPAGIAG